MPRLVITSAYEKKVVIDWDYPGRHIQLVWDGNNMKITNFDDANQFVKRTYRDGWSLGV